MNYYDAHLHLQDLGIGKDSCSGIVEDCQKQGIVEGVVNATSPLDWCVVLGICGKHPNLRPALGLHPWYVKDAPADWLQQLEQLLVQYPKALIGEIGLDKGVRDVPLSRQVEVFNAQLLLAVSYDRPPSIHCVKAWGTLAEHLHSFGKSIPGYLLHSYAGPIEMVDAFVESGAYFSFSGYHMHPSRVQKLEVWKRIPLDRILIETDAPNIPPPQAFRSWELRSATEVPVNHPANLIDIYRWLSGYLEIDEKEFAEQTEVNFFRLFGS